jgi:hypothetical protein
MLFTLLPTILLFHFQRNSTRQYLWRAFWAQFPLQGLDLLKDMSLCNDHLVTKLNHKVCDIYGLLNIKPCIYSRRCEYRSQYHAWNEWLLQLLTLCFLLLVIDWRVILFLKPFLWNAWLPTLWLVNKVPGVTRWFQVSGLYSGKGWWAFDWLSEGHTPKLCHSHDTNGELWMKVFGFGKGLEEITDLYNVLFNCSGGRNQKSGY